MAKSPIEDDSLSLFPKSAFQNQRKEKYRGLLHLLMQQPSVLLVGKVETSDDGHHALCVRYARGGHRARDDHHALGGDDERALHNPRA